MVFQHGLHTRQGCIARTLAKAVDACVDALATGCDGSQDVADGQVVVVVGMEIKAFAICHFSLSHGRGLG